MKNIPFVIIVSLVFSGVSFTACGAKYSSDGDVHDAGNDAVDEPGLDALDGDSTDEDRSEIVIEDASVTCNVEEREDLGAAWSCDTPETCIEDYQEFIQLAEAYADPAIEREIVQYLTDIDDGLVDTVPGPLSEGELQDAIIDGLNIRFMLDGLNERLLIVTTVGVTETDEYDEHELLFDDPWVGVFEGVLLLPKGQGPFPAVVAIHGHNDLGARAYRDHYHGTEYPAHGYAILMLSMRAMADGVEVLYEHVVTRELLLSGFNLIGLRVYETALAIKYLRYLPVILDDRIGLIGHSGGSSASNLTVRVSVGVAAYISDHTVDYAEWIPVLNGYHCETVPSLYEYHALINDFSTSSTPIISVPYGYSNGMEEIFDFFDEHLTR